MPKHMQCSLISERIAGTGWQVGIAPLIADACDVESRHDMCIQMLQMSTEIDDRPDCLGYENDAIAVSSVFEAGKPLSKCGCDHRLRELIVRHRGMADIRGKQHLMVTATWQDQLTVVEDSRFQIGVDHRPVPARPQRLTLRMRDAESPSSFII